MSDTPMTAPTTGEDVKAFRTITCPNEECTNGQIAGVIKPGFYPCGTCDGRGYLIREEVPATAVPDAAAIRRLLEISQLVQGLLFMHGAFGQPWQDNDLGNRLTAALEAITLPHDWESTTAWLAQQEGRDGG